MAEPHGAGGAQVALRLDGATWAGVLSQPPLRGPGALACSVGVRWLAGLARASLACVLDRPVSLHVEAPRLAARPDEGGGYLSVLRVGGQTVRLWMDAAAGRALVWPVLDALAGITDDGPLSEVERGLLAYVLLAVADGIAAVVGPAGEAFGFEQVAEPAGPPVNEAVLSARLCCGTHVGRVWVWAERDLLRCEPLLAVEAAGPRAETLAVALELAAVPLSAAEWCALEAGDGLLLGADDCDGLVPGCAIVTPGGWRVAGVESLDDQPTHVRVRCGSWDPRPIDPDVPGDVRTIRVWTAPMRLAASRIEAWAPSQKVCFAKNPEAPLLLCFDGRPAGTAELVRCAGEMAVRVLSWSPPCTTMLGREAAAEMCDAPPEDAEGGDAGGGLPSSASE